MFLCILILSHFSDIQWSVLLPVVLTLIATNTIESEIVDVMTKFCFTKWAMESFVIANAQRFEITIFIYMQSLLLVMWML